MPAGGDARLLELTSVRDGKKNSNKRDFPGTYPDRVLRGRLLCNLMIYWRSLRDSNPCYSLERRIKSSRRKWPPVSFLLAALHWVTAGSVAYEFRWTAPAWQIRKSIGVSSGSLPGAA